MFTLCSSLPICSTIENSNILSSTMSKITPLFSSNNKSNESELLDSIVILFLIQYVKLNSYSTDFVKYNLDIFSHIEQFSPELMNLKDEVIPDINRLQTGLRIISNDKVNQLSIAVNWPFRIIFDENEISNKNEYEQNMHNEYVNRHFSLPKISFDTFIYERQESLKNQIKINIEKFNNFLIKYKLQQIPNSTTNGNEIYDKISYANMLNAKVAEAAVLDDNIFKKYLEGKDNINNIKDLLVKNLKVNYDGKTYDTGYFEDNFFKFNIAIDDKKPDIKLLYKNEIINLESLKKTTAYKMSHTIEV